MLSFYNNCFILILQSKYRNVSIISSVFLKLFFRKREKKKIGTFYLKVLIGIDVSVQNYSKCVKEKSEQNSKDMYIYHFIKYQKLHKNT